MYIYIRVGKSLKKNRNELVPLIRIHKFIFFALNIYEELFFLLEKRKEWSSEEEKKEISLEETLVIFMRLSLL